MNSIGGIGGQFAWSFLGVRGKDRLPDEELFALGAPAAPSAGTGSGGGSSSSSGYDFRAEEAYNEGFARLRVRLQNLADQEGKETSLSQGKLTSSLVGESSASQAFHEYMAMTPAEKMRDAILKEMGLTEEEIAAMPPEKQKAIEEEIAQRMQQRAELQAAKEKEQSHGDRSSAVGSPEEEASLLS